MTEENEVIEGLEAIALRRTKHILELPPEELPVF